jgi:anti-sigma-K factor RskA
MADNAVHDLTPAYALDALNEHERAAYEAHLGTCDECRAELASFQKTASALAYAVPSPAPPPALRERILEQARSERSNVIPLRPRRVTYALGAVAAAAATVALALGVWSASLVDENRELSALANPDARVIALPGGRGHLHVAPDGGAVLVVDAVPPPRGKDYEVWVITGGPPRRAGLYEGGRNVVELSERVPEGATVAVTLERDGGVDAPTSEPLFAVSETS